MTQIEGAEALACRNGLFTFHTVFEHGGRLYISSGKGYVRIDARRDGRYMTSVSGLHVTEIKGMSELVHSTVGVPVSG